MNMKVVVVWGFAILLLAVVGIFGFLNQDLLKSPTDFDKPYVPALDTEGKSMVCSIMRDNGNSSYRFILDGKTNNIASVYISYSISNADIDTYTSANNLNNATISGLTTNISGSSTDFAIDITANVGQLDTVALEESATDLSKLGIIIENITDYDIYKSVLLASDAYICD